MWKPWLVEIYTITRTTPEVTSECLLCRRLLICVHNARLNKDWMLFHEIQKPSDLLGLRTHIVLMKQQWRICQVGLISSCNSDIYFVRRDSSPRYTLTRSQICRPPRVHLNNQCLHDSAADSNSIPDLINMYLVYFYAKLAFTCMLYLSFFA